MKRLGMEVSRLRGAPGSFARSVLTLMTGTTLANVIPVAVSPVLARLYLPMDFGLFALYAGVSALLAVIATGRYEMAVVLPAEDADAFDVLGLSLLLTLGATALAAALVAVAQSGILALLGAPGLSGWLWWLPAGVFCLGAAQALGSWLNRRRDYPRISQGRIAQAIVTAALSIALARTGLGAGGLILGALAGQALGAAWLAAGAWRGLRGSPLRVTRAGMRRQAVRYREFPRINALHALLDNFSSSAVMVLLTHFFGSVVVGHYAMVLRMLTAPVTLVGSAITQVFYLRAAELQNQGGDLPALMRKVLRRSVWVAGPAAAVLLLTAPVLFPFVFGPEWVGAGRYAQLLSPYMFLYFLAAPLAFVPFVLERQWQSFVVSTTGNALSLACIVVGGLLASPELAFGALSLVQAVYFAFYIAWMLRLAERARVRPA